MKRGIVSFQDTGMSSLFAKGGSTTPLRHFGAESPMTYSWMHLCVAGRNGYQSVRETSEILRGRGEFASIGLWHTPAPTTYSYISGPLLQIMPDICFKNPTSYLVHKQRKLSWRLRGCASIRPCAGYPRGKAPLDYSCWRWGASAYHPGFASQETT